jgi:hypothetical protein
MTSLHIALHDGFKDDTVAIRVNGEKVVEKSGVTTKLQISYADSFDVDVPKGNANVEVSLPLKHLSSSTSLQVEAPVYLGIDLTPENKIDYRISQEPFRYL